MDSIRIEDLVAGLRLEGCFGTLSYHSEKNESCDWCEINEECHEEFTSDYDHITDSDDIVIIGEGKKKWIYSFPELRGFSVDVSTPKLDEYRKKLLKQDDYLILRDIYCSVMIELNRRFIDSPEGVKSTRFRPGKKRPHPCSSKPYSKADSYSSNDSQVIAMHWHHVRGRRHVDSEDKLANKIYCFTGASNIALVSAMAFFNKWEKYSCA